MRNITLPLICTICIALFNSCSGGANNGDKSVIDIESAIGKGAVYNASEFIKSIKYVPLETTPNSIVGNISNIIVENGKIYVSDDKNIINIFDINGKYLNTLNRIGRGPEEYRRFLDFAVSSTGDLFLVSPEQGILKYDANLKFIKTVIPQDNEVGTAGLWDIVIPIDGLFASNTITNNRNTGDVKEEWIIYDIDDSFNIRLAYNTSIQQYDPSLGWFRVFPYKQYSYKNNLNFYKIGNDTIFNIDIENNYLKSAKYIINPGKYHLSEEVYRNTDDISKDSELISLNLLFETDNYLFMNVDFRGFAPEPFETMRTIISMSGTRIEPGGPLNTNVYIIYNKNRGELSVLNHPAPKTLGLKDDIAKGAPFWPKRVSKMQELISWHNALELISLAEEDKIDKSIVGNLKEDDNPVVVIAVPK